MRKTSYRRRLPHIQPEGAALFLTWRLYGSLPREIASRLKAISGGKEFVQLDRVLDRVETGPLWLKDPRIARLVADAFRYGQDVLHLYDLAAWVILANHVHLPIRPHADLSRITEALKGYTASQANRLLHRVGNSFWQIESFDHWVRSESEFNKIVKYIEDNPVKAGLVAKPEDWPWSSATR